MKIKLKITHGEKVDHVLLNLNSSATFGRGNAANVKIEDPKVSSLHCKIIYKPQLLQLLDLESKNGTYINGIRVLDGQLYVGDEVTIGPGIVTIDVDGSDDLALKPLIFSGSPEDRMDALLKANIETKDDAGPNPLRKKRRR